MFETLNLILYGSSILEAGLSVSLLKWVAARVFRRATHIEWKSGESDFWRALRNAWLSRDGSDSYAKKNFSGSILFPMWYGVARRLQ